MRVKNKFLLLFSVLFMAFSTAVVAAKPNAYDIYGHPHYLAPDKGSWIVINYWADWCHACIEEIPELNKLADAVKNMPVIFFGINYDGLPSKIQQAFAKHYQVNYLLLSNNPFASIIPKDQIVSLPVTYVISPKGHVEELDGEQKISDILGIISVGNVN